MGLSNYRDLSVGGTDADAGFQFEFSCQSCSRTWRSPFKPYRTGQLTSLLTRFAFLLPGRAQMAQRAGSGLAEMGSRGAREKALADAMVQAERLYHVCKSCDHAVCDDCWHEREGLCAECIERERATAGSHRSGAAAMQSATAAPSCPNCRAPSSGGRFCAECGFDMASTHKSCPGCGAMQPRQARFCTDCGHGF